MSDVLWRRLTYLMSPQADIYKHLAKRLRGKDVLEIGFGTGFGVLQYASRARSVLGIEIDRGAVEWAQRNIPLDNVAWMHDDAEHYRLNTQFDAAVMFEVLEHIRDYKQALYLVSEHLRDGGTLYLSARNANAELRKNDLHEREWTARELVQALYDHFTEVRLWDYTLEKPQDLETRLTPLVAEAVK